ncbi:glycoside hydrolase family 5 protein [Sporormia fimetaria CBS 119925]|uniref:Glycoside hydrolase family 5 protein n=1 Tax=Sporormia fimetaria CBS 119925 TaxID=1340428 RepID=A0A6A6UWA0_9PLEO|nr:glycoside hydrolase family 5 protein [Sporormia fimetaria CBS 119925]
MDRFLNKAKGKLQKILADDKTPSPQLESTIQNSQQRPSQQGAAAVQPPTDLDILRYRYHHGPNIGSIYVLERWMYPWIFPDGASGESELSAVTAWIDRIGRVEAKKKFEQHWANALSDTDLEWLSREAKCTTIRLPVGYFDLDPSLLSGTTFEPYSDIYSAAWPSIRNLITRLRAHSIGTLLDLHALPGGANKEIHSGTETKRADFWTSASNRALGVRCAEFLAREARNGLPVAGIQLVNEADWDSPHMYEYYGQCIAAVSAIDCSIPVILSDAWNLSKAVDYTLSKNNAQANSCPVIIDTHCYWAFSPEDKAKTSHQIATTDVPAKLNELNGREGDVLSRGAVQVWVGEYSCALDPESFERTQRERGMSKDDAVREFGRAQTKRWLERTGGSFFWTWLTDKGMHAEWNFTVQAKLSAIVSPLPFQNAHQTHIFELVEKAAGQKDALMNTAISQHTSYWDNAAAEMRGEHWRYGMGYALGYSDALEFFKGRHTSGGNRIGNLELWVLKRVKASGILRSGSTYAWIFEHGLRRGIADFNGVAAAA